MIKMIKKLSLKKIIEYLFYLFVFSFSLQTKFIIKAGDSNYNEISLFANYLLLVVILILFLIYKIERKKEEGVATGMDKYWIILAAMEFFIFLSIFVSVSINLSLFRYVLFLLSIAMMFLLLNFKFDFKKIILFFLAGLLFQAVLGIGQTFTQKNFSCKYLGIAYHDVTEPGTSVIETANERFLRAYGATDHPNIFGALMFFAVFLSIMIIVKNNYHGRHRVLAYSSLFIFFIALWASFSRSALLVMGISLLFLLIVFYFENKKPYIYNEALLKKQHIYLDGYYANWQYIYPIRGELIKDFDLKRVVLLFDEAAHVFSYSQQEKFFTFFLQKLTGRRSL